MQRLPCVMLLAIGLISVSAGQVRPSGQKSTTGKQKSSTSKQKPAKAPLRVHYDLDAINNPATSDNLDEGAEGSAVLRAQILLDRAHFSVGEIDGRMGTNAVHAVAGFRAARGLAPGVSVDADVWKALNTDAVPALVATSISADDVKGPFVKVPATMMAQAKMKHLGYSSALEGISEKFHISPTLLQQLNPKTRFTAAGEKFYAPNISKEISGKAARVLISKAQSTVKVLDAAGQVIAQYPCTSGSEHDPLPIGEWKITGVAKNPQFHYNPELFWDAKVTDSKATIPDGPNNPVGLVWIDLSKEHYGIHGTPSPGQIGHAESHGCIRLTNWDAMELAGLVAPGIPAILTE